MKIGVENRKKVIWASVLGGIALILIINAFMSFSSPPSAPAGTQATAPVTATTNAAGRPTVRRNAGNTRSKAPKVERLDPTLDLGLLKESEDTQYSGSGHNIFVAQAEQVNIPNPIAPVGTEDAKKTPPPPPPPPPINLKFYGFANQIGSSKKIFLSQGEDIFVAGEGDVVDRRYKILHIAPTSVEVEDVLTNNRQTLFLTQG
jgi:hypothetical protein